MLVLSLWLGVMVAASSALPDPFWGRALAGQGIAGALSYLEGRQMEDGGFAEPGRSHRGADSTTSWCVMALCAAGRNPHQMRKNGLSPLDFLASQAGSWRSVTDYERTLLAAAAAGENLHDFGGVDLVEKVRSFQRGEGRIGDAVNSNAFGMMAYVAAGIPVPPGAVSWHRSAQNPDGGWGVSPGQASNPDMTAASIMALRAAGVSVSDESLQRAISYLRSAQNPDGGFSNVGGASDTASTAWCVQAIVAMGEDPAGSAWSKGGNTPLSYISSMQSADGHFRWKAGSDMNPVWTTAYALCALARRPFPIRSSFRSPGRASAAAEASPQPEGNPSEESGERSKEETGQREDALGSSLEEGGELVSQESTERGDVAEGVEGQGKERSGTAVLLWVLALVVPAVLAAWSFLGRKSRWSPLALGRRLLSLRSRPPQRGPTV